MQHTSPCQSSLHALTITKLLQSRGDLTQLCWVDTAVTLLPWVGAVTWDVCMVYGASRRSHPVRAVTGVSPGCRLSSVESFAVCWHGPEAAHGSAAGVFPPFAHAFAIENTDFCLSTPLGRYACDTREIEMNSRSYLP